MSQTTLNQSMLSHSTDTDNLKLRLADADSQGITWELYSLARSGKVSMSVYDKAELLRQKQSFSELFELARVIAWES